MFHKQSNKMFKYGVIVALYLFFDLIPDQCSAFEPETKMSGSIIQQEDDMIKLPDPGLKGTMTVEEALQNRRSVRNYRDESLKLEEVSQILWAAYGVTYPVNNAPSYLRGGYKTAPSAGARYPLEIYIVVEEVDGLEKGIYRYSSENHALIPELDGSYRRQLFEASLKQDMILYAPVSLVYTAIYERTTSRYGDRGMERYVCMDLGHSAQNVYLQVEALGLGTCAVGAFDDRLVRNVLALPDKETPLYIMPVGIK